MTDHTCQLRFLCQECGYNELLDTMHASDKQLSVCCLLSLRNQMVHMSAVITKQEAILVRDINRGVADKLADEAAVSKNPLLRKAAVEWRNKKNTQ